MRRVSLNLQASGMGVLALWAFGSDIPAPLVGGGDAPPEPDLKQTRQQWLSRAAGKDLTLTSWVRSTTDAGFAQLWGPPPKEKDDQEG